MRARVCTRLRMCVCVCARPCVCGVVVWLVVCSDWPVVVYVMVWACVGVGGLTGLCGCVCVVMCCCVSDVVSQLPCLCGNVCVCACVGGCVSVGCNWVVCICQVVCGYVSTIVSARCTCLQHAPRQSRLHHCLNRVSDGWAQLSSHKGVVTQGARMAHRMCTTHTPLYCHKYEGR